MIASGDAIVNAVTNTATGTAGSGVAHTVAALAPRIRPLTPADRPSVETIVRATGLFKEDEVAVALEVFDDAVAAGKDTGIPSGPAHSPPGVPVSLPAAYTGVGATVDDQLAGWILWGPTPCTTGTYDMYWLVVDPKRHSQGIGTALVREMERRLAGTARLIVVETAGRPDYASTRAFYEARGYRRTATIPDFYAPDDDLVVYTKSLTTLAR